MVDVEYRRYQPEFEENLRATFSFLRENGYQAAFTKAYSCDEELEDSILVGSPLFLGPKGGFVLKNKSFYAIIHS